MKELSITSPLASATTAPSVAPASPTGKLHRQFAIATVLLALSASLLVGAGLYVDLRRTTLETLEHQARTSLSTVTGRADPLPEVLTPESFSLILSGSPIVGGVLLAENGEIASTFGETLPQIDQAPLPRLVNSSDRYLFMVDPGIGEQSRKLILSVDSSVAMDAMYARLARQTGLLGIVLLLIGAALTVYARHRVFRPLETLTRGLAGALAHPDGAERQIDGTLAPNELGALGSQINELLRITSTTSQNFLYSLREHVDCSAMATLILETGNRVVYGNDQARRLFTQDQDTGGSLATPQISLSPEGQPVDLWHWFSTGGFSTGFVRTSGEARPCLFSCRRDSSPDPAAARILVDILAVDAVSVLDIHDVSQVPTLQQEVLGLRASLDHCLTLLDSYQSDSPNRTPQPVDLNWLVEKNKSLNIKAKAALPLVLANAEDLTALITQLARLLPGETDVGENPVMLRHDGTVGAMSMFTVRCARDPEACHDDLIDSHDLTRRALTLAIIHRLVERCGGFVTEIDLDSPTARVNLELPAAEV